MVKVSLAKKSSKSPEKTHAGPGLRCSLARHYGVTEKAAVRDMCHMDGAHLDPSHGAVLVNWNVV